MQKLVPLSKYNSRIISILIGGLLGDLYGRKGGSKGTGKGTNFTFAQTTKHKEYIEYLWDIFHNNNLTTDRRPVSTTYSLTSERAKTSKYSKMVFYTLTNIDFNIIYDAFYKKIDGKNIKGIYDKELIYELFTKESLAIWFMDDGTNGKGFFKLCTDSFIKEDVIFLQELLEKKYGIISTLHNSGNKLPDGTKNTNSWRIYIPAKLRLKFKNIVEPYIIDSMKHKIHYSAKL